MKHVLLSVKEKFTDLIKSEKNVLKTIDHCRARISCPSKLPQYFFALYTILFISMPTRMKLHEKMKGKPMNY